MAQRQDAIQLLTTDHREVEELFAKLEAGTGDRHDLVSSVVTELSKHDAVERGLLYPTLAEHVPGGQALAEQAIDEHQTVVVVLDRIDKSKDLSSSETSADLANLMSDVRRHVAEEEGEIFPKMRSAMSEDQLLELGDKISAEKGRAPTHPHPHAPASGTALRAAGMGAAAVDKVRDAASGS